MKTNFSLSLSLSVYLCVILLFSSDTFHSHHVSTMYYGAGQWRFETSHTVLCPRFFLNWYYHVINNWFLECE